VVTTNFFFLNNFFIWKIIFFLGSATNDAGNLKKQKKNLNKFLKGLGSLSALGCQLFVKGNYKKLIYGRDLIDITKIGEKNIQKKKKLKKNFKKKKKSQIIF
jgi:hypothetical protein